MFGGGLVLGFVGLLMACSGGLSKSASNEPDGASYGLLLGLTRDTNWTH